MKNLTISEKLQLLMGKDLWSLHNANGKIHRVTVTDGPMGVRQPARDNIDGGDLPSISYPASQTLSFTWNLDLARKTGNAIANDCIQRDMSVLLAPGVNIKRLPICGRNFEYYSEDPLVAGLFGREFIRGVQEKHVGTSLKHFCGNNVEYCRNWISTDVDERTLREIYLVAFEIACQAKPWTVMCAYNLVNGTRMSEHKQLYTLLREEFHFDGAIISDWGAVQDPVASLHAGLDLEMPAYEPHAQALIDAHANGTLDMQCVDQSVERLVTLAQKAQDAQEIRKVDMTVAQREQVALVGAEEGIVLLKNKDNLLPLANLDSKILVTGAPLNYPYFGGGSSQIKLRNKHINLQQALSDFCPNVHRFDSVTCDRGHCSTIENLPGCIKFAESVDISIVCVGNNDACESESFDRQHIKLSRESIDAIKAIAKHSAKTIVVVYAGSAVDMTDWIDDVDAVVWAGFGGEFVNVALAKILVGKVNPSGKLTETIPLRLEDVKAMHSYRDAERLVYEEKLNVGYRYFDSAKVPVLFPFGFGLSYSTFDYENLSVSGSGCDLEVTFEISNVSGVDGKEVAQLYVRPLCPKVQRPNKELKGFCKVLVPANGKTTATITLDKRSFAYYDVDKKQWVADAGDYEIQICSDVQTVRLATTVTLK